MDVEEKINLVNRPPTEEIVTREELLELFKTNSQPKHYIGLEISGFLHLGSLISTGFKINDFIKAGINCTVFLADWHTVINDKLGSSWENISKVSKYYADAFKLVCPGVNIVLGSDLYDSRKEYWAELVKFTKHMSLARTIRTLTIMGRTEQEEKIDLAKLLYPPMQAIDIHSLDLDIVHAGMDQRKIHMLVRRHTSGGSRDDRVSRVRGVQRHQRRGHPGRARERRVDASITHSRAIRGAQLPRGFDASRLRSDSTAIRFERSRPRRARCPTPRADKAAEPPAHRVRHRRNRERCGACDVRPSRAAGRSGRARSPAR